MLAAANHEKNWWHLDQEATCGIGCDAEGPRIGSLRLLRRTSSGWEPRPVEELGKILQSANYSIDIATRSGGLTAVARAMNDGDLVRAIFCTLHLRLLPLRHETVVAAAKQNDPPEQESNANLDETYDRWKRGEAPPGRHAGEFKPKISAEEMESLSKKQVRPLVRAAFFAIGNRMKESLEPFEMHHEIVSVLPPNFEEKMKAARNALDFDDLALAVIATKQLGIEAVAARKFIEGGPRTLDDLRVSDEDKGFHSFDAFKKIEDGTEVDLQKYFGLAPPGHEPDHLVEQTMNRNRFSPQLLHSTSNIVILPKLFHEAKSGLYSSIQSYSRPLTVRQWLRTQSFAEQYRFAVRTLMELGIIRKIGIARNAR